MCKEEGPRPAALAGRPRNAGGPAQAQWDEFPTSQTRGDEFPVSPADAWFAALDARPRARLPDVGRQAGSPSMGRALQLRAPASPTSEAPTLTTSETSESEPPLQPPTPASEAAAPEAPALPDSAADAGDSLDSWMRVFARTSPKFSRSVRSARSAQSGGYLGDDEDDAASAARRIAAADVALLRLARDCGSDESLDARRILFAARHLSASSTVCVSRGRPHYKRLSRLALFRGMGPNDIKARGEARRPRKRDADNA
ncbi:hypothetical protein M885DRAFT_560113 [Pelagophyceae sp. CCMP2097]|nr:hypothetical protein M885DRAFT_560113 [Pelagophyceae sp. CCMP2097]